MSDEETPTTDEMTSYKISAQRVFEIDISEPAVQKMKNKTGVDTDEEAIEQALLQAEKQHVQPEQKLMMIDVQVNESSDN